MTVVRSSGPPVDSSVTTPWIAPVVAVWARATVADATASSRVTGSRIRSLGTRMIISSVPRGDGVKLGGDHANAASVACTLAAHRRAGTGLRDDRYQHGL